MAARELTVKTYEKYLRENEAERGEAEGKAEETRMFVDQQTPSKTRWGVIAFGLSLLPFVLWHYAGLLVGLGPVGGLLVIFGIPFLPVLSLVLGIRAGRSLAGLVGVALSTAVLSLLLIYLALAFVFVGASD